MIVISTAPFLFEAPSICLVFTKVSNYLNSVLILILFLFDISQFKTTHKYIKCAILTGEIFRLGEEAIDGPMLLTCSYFHDLKSAKWAWTDPFTQQQHRTLPQCEAMCKSNPPLDASVRTNWTTVFSI